MGQYSNFKQTKYTRTYYRNECWGSSKLDDSKIIDNSFCQINCSGNDNEFCGGEISMDVWWTGKSYQGKYLLIYKISLQIFLMIGTYLVLNSTNATIDNFAILKSPNSVNCKTIWLFVIFLQYEWG